MSDIKLRTLRYRVVLGDPEGEPDTWQAYEVQSIGRDMTRAETIFARNKWGKPIDRPMMFADLVAWCASTRAGRTELTWEDFQAQYIECAPAEYDDEADAVRPTPPALEAGYL